MTSHARIPDGSVPARRVRKGLFSLLCCLAVSLALNGVLLAKTRSLQEPLDHCLAALRLGFGVVDRVAGGAAPPLRVHDLAGRIVNIEVARPGKSTVLYLFSPQCGWCRRNSANMRALMENAGKRYDFVPISLETTGLPGFISQAGIRGTVYVDPSPASWSAYGFGGTPQTIVIGPDGRIVRNWKGAYAGKVSSEVSSALGVRLPGLSE